MTILTNISFLHLSKEKKLNIKWLSSFTLYEYEVRWCHLVHGLGVVVLNFVVHDDDGSLLLDVVCWYLLLRVLLVDGLWRGSARNCLVKNMTWTKEVDAVKWVEKIFFILFNYDNIPNWQVTNDFIREILQTKFKIFF